MPTLEQIKEQIKELSAEDKIALGSYATAQWTKEKQAAEELELLQSLPTPVTDNDREFIEKNKENKNIQWNKIKFAETYIELDGLKFPRTIVKYDDIKNTPGLKLNKNVYQYTHYSIFLRDLGGFEYDYFTFDAVEQLKKAGYKIPSKDQRQKAIDVFGWKDGIFWLLFNYPKAGIRLSNGMRDNVGKGSSIWTSTLLDDNNSAYYMLFYNIGNDDIDLKKLNTARSLIFLQD